MERLERPLYFTRKIHLKPGEYQKILKRNSQIVASRCNVATALQQSINNTLLVI